MKPAESSGHLFEKVSTLIDQSKNDVFAHANATKTFLFWKIGKTINEDILDKTRADYGAKIVSRLATQLENRYGRTFEYRNLRRMMQFANRFESPEIVSRLATQLSWSHFVEVLPLDSMDARLYYLEEAAGKQIGRDDMRLMISRKEFERAEIANVQLSRRDDVSQKIPFGAFKDPYLFDFMGLQGAFLERDLESAVLHKLEAFILEVGKGLAFVERQKRMIIDNEDFYLDLLFYSRPMKRLVAIELKLDKFHARDKGQMELYLKWLDRYERQGGEESPIGLILCAEGSREQVELLEMGKDGILVSEYWTTLPPKEEFERKIRSILKEVKEQTSYGLLLDPNAIAE